uniref:MFS domain-containing protein n=1 Tax=Haemonchus contortus TaxID=6289 RepID=A0A7I4XTQ8_HAECO
MVYTVTQPDDQPPVTSRNHFIFKNRTRFVILLLCTLCLSIAQSNVLTLNFTVICMVNDPINIDQYNISDTTFLTNNGTYNETGNSSYLMEYDEAVSAGQHYTYSPIEQNMLFLFVTIGALVAMLPAIWLTQMFDSRSVVTIFGLFSAFCTALIPLSAYLGFYWMVIVRFLQIGPIFTMPVAGALCNSSLGWSSVYYLHAIITCILFLLFFYFYREHPDMHAFVSTKELNRINRGKENANKRKPLPLKALVASKAIMAEWIMAMAIFMGLQITMQFSPIYLNRVMKFSVYQTGLFSAIPQVALFVVKMSTVILNEKVNRCGPAIPTKLFNFIAIGGMGITFFILAFVPTSTPTLALVVLIICTAIIGFNSGTLFRSSAIIAAQHNHTVMGLYFVLNCLAALLAPIVVNIFVHDDTWDEWWYVWIVYGIVMTASICYFMVFGEDEPSELTKFGYGAKVAPVLTLPPRSHPRDDRFSMRLNDKFSISVQTIALERCDTCRGNRNSSKSLPPINGCNGHRSSILPPKGWNPPPTKNSSCSLEDYLETEPVRPPRMIDRKIITPSMSE